MLQTTKRSTILQKSFYRPYRGRYLKRLLANSVIDEETHRCLTPQVPKAGRFYILPQIHKPGNPGRPIVAANGHPTEKISEFVSFHLNPLT